MSPKPDFFIVGAARCGTTALFNYLAAHPAVFFPERKEPNYFCTDLRTYGEVATLTEYEALFSPAPPQALTGDASVLYLYSKVAIGQIMAHNVNAKIIAMLRNPIEAAHSMHAFWWSNKLEDVADFEQAWRLQEPRLEGRRLPPLWPCCSTAPNIATRRKCSGCWRRCRESNVCSCSSRNSSPIRRVSLRGCSSFWDCPPTPPGRISP